MRPIRLSKSARRALAFAVWVATPRAARATCEPGARDRTVFPSACHYVQARNVSDLELALASCVGNHSREGCSSQLAPDCGLGVLIDYVELHYCTLTPDGIDGGAIRAIGSGCLMVLLVLLYFAILSKVADRFFCPALDHMANLLGLPDDVAGLTLLSFGNGAPDVFAQVAAVAKRGGTPPNWGLAVGAVLGAGMFVTHAVLAGVLLMVDSHEVHLERGPYLRDVSVYTLVLLALSAVLYDGVVHLMEACLFVAAYFLYVAGAVLQQRLAGKTVSAREVRPETIELVNASDSSNSEMSPMHRQDSGAAEFNLYETDLEGDVEVRRLRRPRLRLLCTAVQALLGYLESTLQLALAVCIPQIPEADADNKDGQSADEARPWDLDVLPLAGPPLLAMLSGWAEASTPALAAVGGFGVLALLSRWLLPSLMPSVRNAAGGVVVCLTFVSCIIWMSAVAEELVAVLETLGIVAAIPDTVLGVTVLAWGNSLGDMVSNCAVAKSGQLTMVMAAIYGGPVFNMLVGTTLSLLIQTAKSGPTSVIWHGHGNEVVLIMAFLIIGQLRALVYVPLYSNFVLHKSAAIKLIACYVAFSVVMVAMALSAGHVPCWVNAFCT